MHCVGALLVLLNLHSVYAIDFQEVFAARPTLRHAPAIESTSRDRYAAATSVLSLIRERNPQLTTVIRKGTQGQSHVSRTTTAAKHRKTQGHKHSTARLPAAKTHKHKANGSHATHKPIAGHAKASHKSKPKQTAPHKKHSNRTKRAAKLLTRIFRRSGSDGSSESSLTDSTLHARGQACSGQTYLYGYIPNPNTPQGFLVDPNLSTTSAAALSPAGYTSSFTSAYGSLTAQTYLGYSQLYSYNTSACAASCDSNPSCTGFNIYFERDPTLDPGATCLNPTAAVSVRCALWGNAVNSAQAQNIGEVRNQFMVLVQGSNGYNKNIAPPSVAGFTGPQALAAAVDATASSPAAAFLLSSTFSTAGYNTSLCANLCLTTTANNRKLASAAGNATYAPCNYFNTFNLVYNNTVQGMYCEIFSTVESAYATQYGQINAGTYFGFTNSYGYALAAPDPGTFAVPTTGVTTTALGALSSATLLVTGATSAAAGVLSLATPLVSGATSAIAGAVSSVTLPVSVGSSAVVNAISSVTTLVSVGTTAVTGIVASVTSPVTVLTVTAVFKTVQI